jgi:hypothetical protein
MYGRRKHTVSRVVVVVVVVVVAAAVGFFPSTPVSYLSLKFNDRYGYKMLCLGRISAHEKCP